MSGPEICLIKLRSKHSWVETVPDFVRVHLFLNKASSSMLEQSLSEGKEQKALLEGLLLLYTRPNFCICYVVLPLKSSLHNLCFRVHPGQQNWFLNENERSDFLLLVCPKYTALLSPQNCRLHLFLYNYCLLPSHSFIIAGWKHGHRALNLSTKDPFKLKVDVVL